MTSLLHFALVVLTVGFYCVDFNSAHFTFHKCVFRYILLDIWFCPVLSPSIKTTL